MRPPPRACACSGSGLISLLSGMKPDTMAPGGDRDRKRTRGDGLSRLLALRRRQRIAARGQFAAQDRFHDGRLGGCDHEEFPKHSIVHASSFSRGKISSEVCQCSLVERGSGAPTGARVQRHPFLWAGHSRGPRASPRGSAFAIRAPGDARLSALHCGDLLAAGPARDETPCDVAVAQRCHWACEHLASARNGGGRGSGASRERGYEPCTQDAASRSDSGSSPETPSVSGTGSHIGALQSIPSQGLLCTSLVIAAAERVSSRDAIAQSYPRDIPRFWRDGEAASALIVIVPSPRVRGEGSSELSAHSNRVRGTSTDRSRGESPHPLHSVERPRRPLPARGARAQQCTACCRYG